MKLVSLLRLHIAPWLARRAIEWQARRSQR